MLRRSVVRRLLNVSGESPSFRAKPGMRNLQLEMSQSPYKEQFKEFWSTPVPWAQREYGEKPRLGDPIPTRNAATAIVCAKNRHADAERVANGEDNDYKILMMYREGKGRFTRDQFLLPSNPVNLEDSTEDWAKILRRRGVTTAHPDLAHRLCAMRALLVECNLLVIPKEGGGLAEVEGPPGGRKWHMMIMTYPKAMKNLVDILELPMETCLNQLLPFRTVTTPETETFRFDNTAYLIPFPKVPCVRFTISTVGERLVWVSPMEAIARYNSGIMEMPTPNVVLLSELANAARTYDELVATHPIDAEPRSILPELVHHGQTKVATVLLPGDMYHSATTQEDKERRFFRRFTYEKDYPQGVRAVFEERPVEAGDDTTPMQPAPPALLEEATSLDLMYASVEYPKRNKKHQNAMGASLGEEDVPEHLQHQYEGEVVRQGKTLYEIPTPKMREGEENPEGYIPVKHSDIADLADNWTNMRPQAATVATNETGEQNDAEKKEK